MKPSDIENAVLILRMIQALTAEECEGSPEYIQYGDERINTHWEPFNKHKGKKKRRKPAKTQLDLLDRKPRQGRKP